MNIKKEMPEGISFLIYVCAGGTEEILDLTGFYIL